MKHYSQLHPTHFILYVLLTECLVFDCDTGRRWWSKLCNTRNGSCHCGHTISSDWHYHRPHGTKRCERNCGVYCELWHLLQQWPRLKSRPLPTSVYFDFHQTNLFTSAYVLLHYECSHMHLHVYAKNVTCIACYCTFKKRYLAMENVFGILCFYIQLQV